MKFIKQLWDNQWKNWEKKGDFEIGKLGGILLMAAILVVIVIIIIVLASRGDDTSDSLFAAMNLG